MRLDPIYIRSLVPQIIYYQTADDREHHHLIDIACENHHPSENMYV